MVHHHHGTLRNMECREGNLCLYTPEHAFSISGNIMETHFLTLGVLVSFSLAERCFSGFSRCLWTIRRPPSHHQWTGRWRLGGHRRAVAAHWKTDEDPCCGRNGRTPLAQNLRGFHVRSHSAESCFG